jgi:hypothetical protein
MKSQPWFVAYPSRLVLEVSRVQNLNRGFVLHQAGSSSLFWIGEACDIPEGITAPPLHYAICYPEAFPAVAPFVRILRPEIDPFEWGHEWHRWESGSVCYVRPLHWNIATTADEIIEKVADWYFNYTAKKIGLIERMPDIGRAFIPLIR